MRWRLSAGTDRTSSRATTLASGPGRPADPRPRVVRRGRRARRGAADSAGRPARAWRAPRTPPAASPAVRGGPLQRLRASATARGTPVRAQHLGRVRGLRRALDNSVFPVPDAPSDDEAAMLDPRPSPPTVKRGGLAGRYRGGHRPGRWACCGRVRARSAPAACWWWPGRAAGEGGAGPRAAGLHGWRTRGIRERTDVGAEVALEVGDPAALGRAALLRKGGRGRHRDSDGGRADPVPSAWCSTRSRSAGARRRGRSPQAIALNASARPGLGELIAHRFALEDFADVRDVHRGRDGALKVIIRP